MYVHYIKLVPSNDALKYLHFKKLEDKTNDCRRMKHKKYLRKQVEGDGEDSENVSDEKEDDEASINLKYIKKEDIRGGEDRDQLGNGRHLVGKLCFLSEQICSNFSNMHGYYWLWQQVQNVIFSDNKTDQEEAESDNSLLQQR